MIEDSWARIVAWCEQHAPEAVRTLRPRAGEEALTAAEVASGCEWPEDLRRWYRLHDGCREYPYSVLLAPWMPLPLAGVVEEVRHQADLLADLVSMPWADPEAVERSRTEPAGVVPAGFLPSFVPIAVDLQGGTLYVDTRPGHWSGCVTEYGDDSGRRWDSVTEMVAEIAEVLEAGGVSGHHRPRTVSGWLEWGIVPGPNREPREGSWIEERELSDEEAVRRLRESQDLLGPEDRFVEPAEPAEEKASEPQPQDTDPVPGFEPDTVLLEAVLAEIGRNPTVSKVCDLPLGRLDALFCANQGAPSGFLSSVLFGWGVEEEPLVRLDSAMTYQLVGHEEQYSAVDRGAAAAVEALRMPLVGLGSEGAHLLDLSPGELVRRYADCSVAYYRDGQTELDFFGWSQDH